MEENIPDVSYPVSDSFFNSKNICYTSQLKTKCSLARLYENTGRAIALTLVSASASASMLASAPACVEISAGPFD